MRTVKKISGFFLFLTLLSSSLYLSAQCDNQSAESVKLKILSWNIYMLPHFFIHTGQLERAREIADMLQNEDADIIVFQEAFDRRSREIIYKSLRKNFPYESGSPSRNVFWKTNCGVWILSKTPITVLKRIYFSNAAGSDKLASKGALLTSCEKDGYCFQLVGTHLQSDLDYRDVKDVRLTQYEQIRRELLEPFSRKDVPQFVVGDMNTIYGDSAGYNKMLSVLKVQRCAFEGSRLYSYDYSDNDFILGSAGIPQLIDHIFYRSNELSSLDGKMSVKIFRKKWGAKHADLSDHFAVSGIFTLR